MSILLAPLLASASFAPAGRMAMQQQRNTVSRATRGHALSMAETLVVTDGTDSFLTSRTAVQTLFNFGEYSKITSLSPSVACDRCGIRAPSLPPSRLAPAAASDLVSDAWTIKP